MTDPTNPDRVVILPPSPTPPRPTEGHLAQHAWDELDRAGLFDRASDYEGALGVAVMELVHVFARHGHSGASAAAATHLFSELVAFRPLSPLTNDPDEWVEVADGLWQSRREPEAFSRDGGATYRLNSDRDTIRASERSKK